MSNIWDDIRRAVEQSKETLRAADDVTADMIRLAAPRLRSVDASDWRNRDALKAMKKQLRDFDMVTGKWKD